MLEASTPRDPLAVALRAAGAERSVRERENAHHRGDERSLAEGPAAA
jgi:hypothetical protein